jgi:hypothetical protein
MPVRYYQGTFTLDGRRLWLPVANGCPPLWVRLDRDVPCLAGQIRSVTLMNEGGRRHNRRVRDWRVGHLIGCLTDKAEQAGIVTMLVDELVRQ